MNPNGEPHAAKPQTRELHAGEEAQATAQEPGAVLRLLRHCVWPELPIRYDRGLRVAVRFILENFAVHGVVLSGTVLEGVADARSDLDLYVIHAQPQRRRLQRWFNGIPTEIFVNPVGTIRAYFADERNSPSTANMLAKGHVIYAQDPIVEQLRREAHTWLTHLPDLAADTLRWQRYSIADQLDNAKDTVTRDPAMAQMLLAGAVQSMVTYAFLAANRHLPRAKRTLDELATFDPETADSVRRFYLAADIAVRLSLAEAIAMRTIGVTGFFEWDSPWDTPDVAAHETNDADQVESNPE
ncbi:MAG: hypothetical protein WDZ49_11500 [Litorilinea sp.]